MKNPISSEALFLALAAFVAARARTPATRHVTPDIIKGELRRLLKEDHKVDGNTMFEALVDAVAADFWHRMGDDDEIGQPDMFAHENWVSLKPRVKVQRGAMNYNDVVLRLAFIDARQAARARAASREKLYLEECKLRLAGHPLTVCVKDVMPRDKVGAK